MNRSIIKLGASTLVVSLPKTWTKRYGLNARDEVIVEERGKQLTLSTEKDTALERATLALDELAPLHNYALLSLYIRGVDEIEVTSKKPEYISALTEHPLPQFIGYEIIEQTKNRALIKDVSGIANLELNTLFRRIFLLLLSMSEEIVNAFSSGQSTSHVISIDQNVNKFTNLALRILNKRGADQYTQTATIYHIVCQLESIGDDYKSIASITLSCDQTLVKLLRKNHELLRKTYELFFTFDTHAAAEIEKSFRVLNNELAVPSKKISAHQVPMRSLIQSSAHKIADILRNLLVLYL